jgi:membrane-associated phospholipid phosphatase
MCRNLLFRRVAWLVIMMSALIILASMSVRAQNPPGITPAVAQPSPSPSPRAQPSPSLERRFFYNILRDQRAIWTAPFHVGRDDARWLLPLGLSTGALFATDRRTAGELAENGEHQTRLRISRDVSRGGAIYTTSGIAAAFYLIGRAAKNSRARETGLLGAEALIDGGIVSTALKAITQRPRPRVDDASGEFFDRGNSFPSGHATSAWSLATVIANEYGKRRPLVRFGLYGLAAAVSLSRYTGRNHFLSDVLVGSAIGYGIGRYVYRTHHDPSIDGESGQSTSSGRRSKLRPSAVPLYSRAARSYGVALAWEF